MSMRQYICHTNHNLWDIIVNGDLEDEATPSGEQSSPPVPKTAKYWLLGRNQERIKSTFATSANHLMYSTFSKFHNFENFVTASNETLDKAYDRFQKLISQLEIHGAYVSKEDINQKFLRSLPPSWSQIALIMRNKPDIDEVDIDDLYNNLRVYEDELKRSSGSNSASQNLAFLSSENTNSTNEVSTGSGDFGVSTAGGINQVPSTPSAHDIAYSFLAQPTTSPQLENEDFQQMDGDDLEELDLRWQVAMLTVRIECYNCHRKGHFARECRSGRSQGRRPNGDNGRSSAQTTESSSQALVAQDGLGGYDWSNDFEVEPVNYALMAISSSNSSSSSDSEVQKCSKCLESFKCLQKNYDTEREKHNKAKLEIRGYEIALESLEARILGHEKNELAWGERYEFQNYDLKCREIKINNLNLELEKVVKERDELKLKIEKWEGSSKNLTKILNSQMSAHDKNGLGFGTQMDDLSNKSETVSENSLTVFEVRSSDDESTLANNRFTKSNEYHAVPPPITGNPLTPRADISFAGLDEYAFRNKIIESKTTKTNKTVGTTNEATIVKPKSVNETVVSKSKINRNEVIIEDWTSDDEDDVCAVKTVSSVKPNVTQAVRSQADKSGQTSQKQGIDFKKVHKIKACFVCKSTDHLIKDCDFYKSPEPRVKNVVNTGERVVKPVWDYGKRSRLDNTDRSNVSTARSISTVRPVNIVRPVSTASVIRPNHPRLDIVRPKASNSPIKRSYFTQPVYRPKDLKPDVKTFGVKNMTTVGTRAVVSKGKVENVLKKAKWGNPEILLQDHAVVDSGCSSHMTGNKAYLSDYEDFNGGFVAFGSDPKGGGCQFLGRILISWQCKKQTIMANSTTEAEYVAAVNYYGQVLWIQNQRMDYGFNFMNTKIHIDHESTISVIKNLVAHSRTKHIEIRFHFIRDCYEKRRIEVIKIHTDSNVVDLFTKGFDVTRFNFLVILPMVMFSFSSLGSRESLKRDMDGTEEFLFFFAIRDATTINTYLNYMLDPSSLSQLTNPNHSSPTITKIKYTMASLNFCSNHNMVAYLEKTDGNIEFHQIMDFLTRSSIHYALTVSPIVSTLFVEQFWTTAKSRTVNNISYIDATVAGKPVTISEASIRSNLLFDDVDGIDSLNNQALFDTIQLMRNEGDLMGIMEVTNQAKEIKHLKVHIKKLKKKAKPVITHHKAWMKSVALKTRLARKTSLKKKGVQKGSVVLEEKESADKKVSTEAPVSIDKQDEGVVLEEKESVDKEVSTEAPVSTDKQDEGTDKRNEGTDKQDGDTDSI
ncbi:putative ribonuclease H-like domain-containing protein [Tanacetum coccineum]